MTANLELRIEIKSITAEAQILRDEADMAKWRARGAKANENRERHLVHFEKIHNRRTNLLRSEARSVHLAYGFLNGLAYRDMEEISYVQPNWARIQEIIIDFAEEDGRDIVQKFSEWIADAANGAEILSTGGVIGRNGSVIYPQPHSVKNQWITSKWLLRDYDGDLTEFNKARAYRLTQIEAEYENKVRDELAYVAAAEESVAAGESDAA